jgi:hypothetical protein
MYYGVDIILKDDKGLTNFDSLNDITDYTLYMKHLFVNHFYYKDHDFYLNDYLDVFQIPLQPLKDNLQSQTYECFEDDVAKYNLYEKALYNAFVNYKKTGFLQIEKVNKFNNEENSTKIFNEEFQKIFFSSKKNENNFVPHFEIFYLNQNKIQKFSTSDFIPFLPYEKFSISKIFNFLKFVNFSIEKIYKNLKCCFKIWKPRAFISNSLCFIKEFISILFCKIPKVFVFSKLESQGLSAKMFFIFNFLRKLLYKFSSFSSCCSSSSKLF